MKLLAIETSTMLGGVALSDDKSGLIAEIRLNVKTTHSERLMTAADHLLVQSELGLHDIDAIAVASGPGSFTGLRIGLSTAKGLCYAAKKPLVTVPTLDAFARNFAYALHPVCLMLDARKDEVYCALYRWRGEAFDKVMAETAVRPEDILTELEGTVIFAGEGVAKYRDRIVGIMGGRALLAGPDKTVPSPANVAMLGLEKALRGEYEDPVMSSPVYIRKSEAEIKWSERT